MSSLKSVLAACLVAVPASQAIAQTNPYQPPLYWSTYEYNIVRQHFGACYNYVPEYELQANIDWVDENLKPFGYNMIEIDGWGDSTELNENGYRTTHSRLWEHDFAFWAAHLESRGMQLGMYANPLWIHVDPSDTETKVVGTDINVSSLIDRSDRTTTGSSGSNPPQNTGGATAANTSNPNVSSKGANECGVTGSSPGNTSFTWVQVEQPGAEQYIKGYIKFYADMGVKFLRVDFLPWYETGFDHYLGRLGPPHSRENYETVLRWMREACDQHGVFLSLAMANLFNEGELEKKYAHSVRINEDVDYGEWWKFSDKDRGRRFKDWSQWANAFDGFSYWSYISGRDKMRLDGDFIRMNTYRTDSEKRTVISTHLIAGGPVSVTDQYNSIGKDLWVYQNDELLALNADAFVGQPLTNDPTNEASQIWTGQMSNGDRIIGLFNRESTPRNRSLAFSDVGFVGEAAVRDLWQHADLGSMSSISVDLPPHGSLVLKLTQQPSTCRPQSLTFSPIADWTSPNPPPALSATASSGLPVEFEVALGPATVEGNQVQPTGQSGTVHVVAKQTGDGASCAAIPQVQSFEASGPHQSDMFLFGTFTNWTPVRMRLEGGEWVAENIPAGAGAHEFKFANSNDFSGIDWGNGDGLSSAVSVTTGGGPNARVSVPETEFFTVKFNDETLQYFFDANVEAESISVPR